MKWFRMYHEARTDNKLRYLDDHEFRVWFNLLCFSSEQEERGVIPAENRFRLAIEVANSDEALLSRTLDKLTQLEIVDDTGDTIIFKHFAERQYDHPSDRPEAVKERVARHRAKKQQGTTSNDETTQQSNITTCNDPVTTCNDIDSDTDIDSDINIINNSSNDEFAAGAASEFSKQKKLDNPSYQPSPEEEVMNHYNAEFKGIWKRPLKLTPDRRQKIKARLRTYSVAEICQAIDNIRASPYHCGENPNKQIYATPEFICRNDGMIDKWLNMPVKRQKQEELDLVEAYYADRKRAAAELGS